MRFSLRLNLFLGVFTTLVALVAGFIPQRVNAPLAALPAGVTGEVFQPPVSWAAATSGICLIRVTDGGYTATATGFVIRTGEILSSRVRLCPYASNGQFLIWPNSLTNPVTRNDFDPAAVIATATFPGCNHPVPLEVDGFSTTSNVVRYRFDTKWVAALIVTINPFETLEVGKSYLARGYKGVYRGLPARSMERDSPQMETESVTKREEIVFNVEDGPRAFSDEVLMLDFSPGTPVFNDSGEVIGLFMPDGGMGSLGEGVRTIKPVRRRFESSSGN